MRCDYAMLDSVGVLWLHLRRKCDQDGRLVNKSFVNKSFVKQAQSREGIHKTDTLYDEDELEVEDSVISTSS